MSPTSSAPSSPQSSSSPVGASAKLLSATIIYGLGDAVNRSLASFILIPLYTHFLSPSDYGIITTLTPFAWFLITICGMGMSGTVVRFYHDSTDETYRRKLCGTAALYLLLAPLLVVVPMVLFARPLFDRFFGDIPFSPYGLLAIWFAYFMLMPDLLMSIWRAKEKPLPYILFSCTGFAFTAGAIAFLVVKMQMGVFGKMTAEVAVAVAMSLVAVIILAREMVLRMDFRLLRSLLMFGAPLVPHLIGRWLLNYASRMILLDKAGLAEAGLFGLGSQVGGILLIIVASAGKAMNPWFYRTANEPHAEETLSKIATWFFVGIATVTLLVCVFAREVIIVLARPEYIDAYRVVPLIAAGALCVGAYYYPIMAIMFTKRTVLVPILTGISAVVTIAANLLLIPRWGIMGAGVATAMGQFVLFTLTFTASQRLYPIRYEYGKLSRMLFVYVVMYALLMLLPTANHILAVVCVKVCAVATVPLWLLMCGTITTNEIRSFVHAIVVAVDRRRR